MTASSHTTSSTGVAHEPSLVEGVRELERGRLRAVLRARMFGGPATAVRLGRFALERKIGEGGAGVVYAAFDPTMQRRVALKALTAAQSDRRALLREARALAQLSHPNVLGVFEVHDEGDIAFVVSELVEAGSLREWMRGEHTLLERIAIVSGVAAGVSCAHRAGLVHRDLKPENVLVGEGRPRVADFGLARLWAAGGDTWGEHRVVGTPGYMAPEQRRGAAPAPSQDQWSLGVMAYELLFGRHPYAVGSDGADGPSRPSVHVAGPPPPPAADHPAGRAWPVLARALDDDPQARWPDVDAFARAIEDALAPAPVAPPARPRALVVGAVVTAALALGLTALALRAREQRPTQDASVDSPGDPWAAQYPTVAPMLARRDWVACSAFFEAHETSPAGHAVWATCARASGDGARIARMCEASSDDATPPEECDALLTDARSALNAGRPEECIKRLWEGEHTMLRGVLMGECASGLASDLRGGWPCLYATRSAGPRGPLTTCGFAGHVIGTNGLLTPVDAYARSFAAQGEWAACRKLAEVHGGLVDARTCVPGGGP
ncbi:MAG: serine/threonine protein kinase [Sandaracinaceae bacterium]|nr:serine/threonine protein kinase [Sandaracinaceae bacterium]